MSAPTEYLARIKPSSKRQTQVLANRTFRKSKNWYGPIVDPELLELLRNEPEHDQNPHLSEKVFDVMTADEVNAIERAEQTKRAELERVGTAHEPRPTPTRFVPHPVAGAPAQRRGR